MLPVVRILCSSPTKQTRPEGLVCLAGLVEMDLQRIMIPKSKEEVRKYRCFCALKEFLVFKIKVVQNDSAYHSILMGFKP